MRTSFVREPSFAENSKHDERPRAGRSRVPLRDEFERTARARPGRCSDEVRVDHLAGRVRRPRTGSSPRRCWRCPRRGSGSRRSRTQAETRRESQASQSSKSFACTACRRSDDLDGRELGQRVDDLGEPGSGDVDRRSGDFATPLSIVTPEMSTEASELSSPARPRRHSSPRRARRAPPGQRPASAVPRGPRAGPCR